MLQDATGRVMPNKNEIKNKAACVLQDKIVTSPLKIGEIFNQERINMEVTGKIIAVLPEQNGVSRAGNEWKKQEYVLETHDQYPKKICFQIFGAERIAQAAIQPGEELTVSFDIDSREWQGRWFTSINAWKVERPTVDTFANAAGTITPNDMTASAPVSDFGTPNPIDDLPF